MLLIRPMLAQSTKNIPVGNNEYAYEIKWDGLRSIVYLDNQNIKLLSRNDHDITFQYPELQKLSTQNPCHTLILDGEIVVLQQGIPSFGLLQKRMNVSSPQKAIELSKSLAVTYVIFDVLYYNDTLLTDQSYVNRRALLDSLNLNGAYWQTPPYKTGQGEVFFSAIKKLNLEGLIAKKLDSIYLPGRRSPNWLKIKNTKRQEFVIGGWTEGQGMKQNDIGALLVGYFDNSQLLYAGKVGSGLGRKITAHLLPVLHTLHTTKCPFQHCSEDKNVNWVAPKLICEVEFTEWTMHQTLRHPAFKGIRKDKNPQEVHREEQ